MRVLGFFAGVAVCACMSALADDASLLASAEAGDRAAVEELLRTGADVNARGADGTTPLMWAAHRGDAEMVRDLLAAGADTSARNEYGVSALAEAAYIASTPVIDALLQAGADADSRSPEGETPLMLAARAGNAPAAELLLNAGASVDARESWGGQTALMWAAARSQPGLVRLLIARGADVDARGAAREWQRKITAEPRPKDMNKGGFTPLLYAAREGCLECAAHLLAAGADPDLGDPENVSPLIVALDNLHFDFAALMIRAGADVNQWDFRGRSPLYMAVDMNTLPTSARGDLPSLDETTGADVARMLLEAGANPNLQLKRKPPYRHRAIDRGGDNLLNIGATPLLRAARACDVELVALLLRHGALVDLATAYGVTPLMAAAGVDHNERATRGHYRSEADTLATLQLLLDAGADIKARMLAEPPPESRPPHLGRQNFGKPNRGRQTFGDRQVPSDWAIPHWNAVHGAAMSGWTYVVQFLADHGAELDLIDADGKTPIALARGDYEPAIRLPRPEPYPETVALLEKLVAGVPVAEAANGR